MPTVMDWRQAGDPRVLADHAARVLRAGGLVALPTDAGYAVAASPDALPAQGGWAIALADADGLAAWVPEPTPTGLRLAQRVWPGPLVLEFPEARGGRADGWPPTTRARAFPGGGVALWAPESDAVAAVLATLGAPLLLAELPPVPGADTVTATDALAVHGDRLELTLDDGPRPVHPPATRVRVTPHGWEVIEPGEIREDDLAELVALWVVFVCTGNTCRSPLAEALCKKLLAERIGCAQDELPRRGFRVLSAGVAAHPGDGPTPEAVLAAEELGAELRAHRSRPLHPEVLAAADYLITMTDSHRQLLRQALPGVGPEPRLLCGDEGDLLDPYGNDLETYRACARTVLRHLDRLLPELRPI